MHILLHFEPALRTYLKHKKTANYGQVKEYFFETFKVHFFI